jgi:lipopolysaccharide/colanic/teichoic acid biosynthesis glycosyltransferase
MKRLFDIVCSSMGLLLLLPLVLIVSVVILVTDGRPVLFSQMRVGYRGKLFRMWKFRTMVRDAEKIGKQLTVGGDSRITRVGYCLRKFKLDELPQLYNVLVGEMSLVGPRPEVQRYVDFYTADQRRVLELVPGITDPASIRYCDEATILASSAEPEATYVREIMPHKVALNLEYSQRRGFFRDLMVLLATIVRIFSWRKRPLVLL